MASGACSYTVQEVCDLIGEEDSDQEFLFSGSDDDFGLSDLDGDSDALDRDQGKQKKQHAPVQQLQMQKK